MTVYLYIVFGAYAFLYISLAVMVWWVRRP